MGIEFVRMVVIMPLVIARTIQWWEGLADFYDLCFARENSFKLREVSFQSHARNEIILRISRLRKILRPRLEAMRIAILAKQIDDLYPIPSHVTQQIAD